MTRLLAPMLAALLLVPLVANAQKASPQSVTSGAGAQGQQRDQPIPNQNQSQLQSDQSEQPPEVTGSQPEAGASRPPNPTFTR